MSDELLGKSQSHRTIHLLAVPLLEHTPLHSAPRAEVPQSDLSCKCPIGDPCTSVTLHPGFLMILLLPPSPTPSVKTGKKGERKRRLSWLPGDSLPRSLWGKGQLHYEPPTKTWRAASCPG